MPQSKKKIWAVWFKRKSDLKARSRFVFFLICVAFSVFLWLLNKLSDNYKTIIHFPVKYINLPENKIYTNILPAHISVEIEASGYTLLQYNMYAKKDTIFIDYASEHGMMPNNKEVHYICLKNRKDELRNQLKSIGSILSISPDTVFFNFADKNIIEIPVKLNAQLSFKKQFQLKDAIIIEPSFIEVYGPSENINNLSFIETEELKLENLSDDYEVKLNLIFPKSIPAYYRFSQRFVNVKIPVERYTETSLLVKIKSENLPEGYSTVLIPDKAEIKLQVPFSKFAQSKNEEWNLVADFSDYKNKNRVELKLISTPEYVRLIEIEPKEVEYILIKNND
jgi:YbbR domain-containing protein